MDYFPRAFNLALTSMKTNGPDKTDMFLALFCYGIAFWLLFMSDWKLAAALLFYGVGKLCEAEASTGRKPPNEDATCREPSTPP